jgi:membrane-associated protease RseP (regulator of RpoE activity)
MRRLFPWLCAAGLAVAPLSAAADPPPPDRPSPDRPQIETFEWSTATDHARLGVMVIGITPELRKHFGAAEDRGVLIARVEPKSAAASAGLEVGDLIVEVRGRAIDSAGDVLSALAPAKQGDTVSIAVIRDHKPLTLQAKLTTPAPRATAAPPRWLNDWLEEMRRGLRNPDWFEDMRPPFPSPRPDHDRGAGGASSTRT